MRRALATNTIAFSKELSAKKVPTPKMTTLVVEVWMQISWFKIVTDYPRTSTAIQNCRERMYKDDSENRHTKNWISNMFSNFQIEHGFTDQDELWDPKHEESLSSFRARVRKFLDRVFSPENASVKCKWFIDLLPVFDYSFVISCFYHCSPRVECYVHGSGGTTVVSPSQTAIYVKCPTVHDIWSLFFTTPPKPCQKVVM